MIEQVRLVSNPHNKFHFGCGKNLISEAFQSDKLFSAIINNLTMLVEPEVIEELLKLFLDGRVKLSDLVLIITLGEDKRIRLFPKPLILQYKNQSNYHIAEDKKQLRQVKYISEDIIQLLKFNKANNILEIDYKDCIICKDMVISRSEAHTIGSQGMQELTKKNVFLFFSIPRVTVDRNYLTANEHYYENYMTFNTFNHFNVDYMFYLYTNSTIGENDKALIKRGIDLIPHEGLGGKRSKAYGTFSKMYWESLDDRQLMDRFDKKDEGIYLSLSSFIPKEDNVLNNLLAYNISERNGFIFSNGMTTKRKKSIFVLDSGMISNYPLEGKVIDTNSKYNGIEHPTYVNGNALFISIGSDYSG